MGPLSVDPAESADAPLARGMRGPMFVAYISIVGVFTSLAAALVLYRRLALPLAKLTAHAHAVTGHRFWKAIRVAGAATGQTAADDLGRLRAPAAGDGEDSSRLAALVEFSTDAIIGKTLDGVITSWNSGAEKMYGYRADEIVGRSIADLIPSDRSHELGTILERVRQGQRVEHFETRRTCKDGSTLDVSVSVAPVRDASGAVVGASTVARDMTERNLAESHRRALERQLHQSERLESLGQLAGGIAHDFNNLLAAIMNYASFVAEETADRPSVRADVQQIQTAAERAARLTKQLLIFARNEAVEPEALRLDAIVTDIGDLLSRGIGENIELRVHTTPDLPAVRADRGQVEQVLLNLAVNARDAMAGVGTLTIATRPVTLDEGYARLHPGADPGRYVELEVSDTGAGMSPAVVAHIFEPFFTTKPEGQGTGLGLATVHGIVTKAGGSMTVCSEEGSGTAFSLYFPAIDTPVPVSPASDVAFLRGNGETILIVDDEPAVLELTSRVLRQAGYLTLDASTAEKALVLAGSRDFQLLLTDCAMPQVSGRTLAGHIDELQPGRALLYMSDDSEAEPGAPDSLEGGVAFVQKPFDRRTLLERTQAALKERAKPLPSEGG